ncbi:MAG: CoA transferase subunit A [Treponema sp.]|jgi:acetate CoA/acetoacetate CoA-transferase alpha subunit|nr:CoA transferase subunit A [Treponema sp.]
MTGKLKASAAEAAAPIQDGAVIMVGGFMGCGTPETLIDALTARGVKDLTIICNDAACPGRGVGKLIDAGLVRTLIASHVGLNPEAARRINAAGAERLECVLVPQGTLAERIRAGGTGLGGILTPTGVGTEAARGKQLIRVDGRDYLLETPLRAEFALIRASRIDHFGNSLFYGATRNFNPLMAPAADYVIAGAGEVVETGQIDPSAVHLSGIFVDAITGGEQPWPV